MGNTFEVTKFSVLGALLLLLLLMGACSLFDEDTPEAEIQLATKTSIIIGNLTDITGVSSNAMSMVNKALADMVKYYNEENLIPGVELEVVTYDGQFDPSRDIPGYQWLKRRDADLIFTPMPSTTETLKRRVEDDKMVLFALAPSKEGLLPPGYAFCPGNTYAQDISYTLLKWIAENDPDFPKDRPAKIGGAFWAEAYGEDILRGAEQYAKTHPDQYDWEGGYLTNFTFTWGPEVEDLKNCDYVLPPVPMNSFAKEYRMAGYEAKFIGTAGHVAFMGLIDYADLWNEIDGTLIIQTPWWWNEESTMSDLAMKLLYDNHADEAEVVIRSGNGYLSVVPVYIMLEIISNAVDAVGPEGFNSEALYEAAKSFSLTLDGFNFSFSETNRTSVDHLGMYEIRGSEKDVFRVDSNWVPIVKAP
ncbi:MAG: ABC transporter substrate-binding protein [Chloroflexi bacterium]|jgi:hypothetical protein|nr:ABC transporter substrate-binding protein [Chloroflexota bacterium]